jgi:hypothetical protein
MDDLRFDTFVKRLGTGNRRGFLRYLLGIGASAAVGLLLDNDAQAARRGFPGPTFPTLPPCQPICDGSTCGGNGCGGT